MIKVCEICYREFAPQKKTGRFCSKKCLGAWNAIANLGKKLKEETKSKISIAKTGVHVWGGSRETPWMIGEKNCNWTGDNVGYRDIHKWVERWEGKAQHCEKCGDTDPRHRYHWANINHTYKRVLDDYIQLCPKCHGKYDADFGLRQSSIKKD